MSMHIPGLEDIVEVGRGGFATVYRAYQPAFRRTVALKVITNTENDETARERFRRECQAMGLLSDHPSIVTVLDAGFLDDGRAYLVMPFMPAGSLSDQISSTGAMTWPEATKAAVRLAGALSAAHNSGVIHRDVKPANVLVSEYGEPKLADFGIARVAGTDETQAGTVTASLAYAAPEVLNGEPPTVRSDIYSLGATVYMLLTGEPPFVTGADTSVSALLTRILNDEPRDLADHGVPAVLADVVHGAMAKDPNERFNTAEAFGRAIRLAQDELGIKPTELLVPKSDRSSVTPILRPSPSPDDVPTMPAKPSVDDGATRDLPVVGREPAAAVRTAPARHRLLAGLAAVVLIALAWLAIRPGGSDPESSAGHEGTISAPVSLPPPTENADQVPYSGPVVDDPLRPDPWPMNIGFPEAMDWASNTQEAAAALCPEGLVRDLTNADLRGVAWIGLDLRCSDFRGANLDGADFRGAVLWGSNLTGVDLRSVNFGDSPQLWGITFVDADLRGVVFPAADLWQSDLSDADLRGAIVRLTGPLALLSTTCPDGTLSDDTQCGWMEDPEAGSYQLITWQDVCPEGLTRPDGWPADGDLSGRDLTDLTFRCTDLSGANLRNASLNGSSFIGVDLSSADLTGATLNTGPGFWPVWVGVDVEGTTFDGMTLHARLYGMDLEDVDFGAANLALLVHGALADGIRIEAAGSPEDAGRAAVEFQYSSVVGGRLADSIVNAQHSDLTGADLSRSVFLSGYSKLISVTLTDAELQDGFIDVDLSGATGTGVRLSDSVAFSESICPDGSRSAEHLGICPFN